MLIAVLLFASTSVCAAGDDAQWLKYLHRQFTGFNFGDGTIRATLSSGMNIDVEADRATGAYKYVILDPGGDYETILKILAYGEVAPGIKMISSWQYEGEDGKTIDENVKLNPIVADSDLHPPPQTAHWSFGATGVVPITQTHDRLVVHALVNGVLGTFLVDTGADDIYLSGAFARRAGLSPIGHTEVGTLYGTELSDIGKVQTMELGDNTLYDVIVNYGMDEPDPRGPDGLLGYGLFAGARVSIDFKNSTMTFKDPIDPAGATSGVRVDASFGDGHASIPMLLNKSLGLDAVIDTGAPGGVVIPSRLLSAYGLHFYQTEGGGCGTIDTLTVASLSYYSPKACVAYQSTGRWILVGMDFLNQFDRVDFDYPDGTVTFFPKKGK
ncbi:MAG TPA: retropepsin-like aspartic protease [Candidatus Baltobacteraceae bacterium]|nr:retropepsin-like aspartic protease [Candidatus Baltobacteraceae bacterium]